MTAASQCARDASTEVPGLRGACRAVVYPHVFDAADREVGGVLVGRLPAAGGLPFVTGAIPALHADEQRADVTFTQATWAHVHAEIERGDDPDARIVGWYHSHPAFGVFLSEHDAFMHRTLFSHPSQIALVVDPLRQTEGVYRMDGDEIQVLAERPTPSRWIAATAPAELRTAPTPARVPRSLLHVAVLLVGALLGLGLHFGVLAERATPAPHAPARTAPAATHARHASAAPKKSTKSSATTKTTTGDTR